VALNQTVLQVYLSTVDMALDIGYMLVLAVRDFFFLVLQVCLATVDLALDNGYVLALSRFRV
jgi:hypothetical protein